MMDDSIDLGNLESGDEAPPLDSADSEIDDAPIVKFLQKILIDGINAGASDLHFEPYEKFYRIRYRVDGELREVAQAAYRYQRKIIFTH